MKKIVVIILRVILITLAIIFILGYFIKKRNETPPDPQEQIVTQTRKADNSDIENVDFVFSSDYKSVSIRFFGKNDIQNLTVKVLLRDSTDYLLDQQILTVGNVSKGQQYFVTATLPNNAFTHGKVIKTCELNVNSGTVTYSYMTGPGLYPSF